jgi:hypothetical protein
MKKSSHVRMLLSIAVFAQTMFPGWTATAADRYIPVVRHDEFLAAPIQMPSRVVTFRYKPWWFVPLMVISLLSFVVTATIIALCTLRRAERRRMGGCASLHADQ